MTMTTKESLVDEIIENARKDRKRLESVAKGLTGGLFNLGSEDDGTVDEETAAAFAEEISKISDSLTKINQGLIELVKMDAKKAVAQPDPTKLSEADKESLYDEVDEKDQKELN